MKLEPQDKSEHDQGDADKLPVRERLHSRQPFCCVLLAGGHEHGVGREKEASMLCGSCAARQTFAAVDLGPGRFLSDPSCSARLVVKHSRYNRSTR